MQVHPNPMNPLNAMNISEHPGQMMVGHHAVPPMRMPGMPMPMALCVLPGQAAPRGPHPAAMPTAHPMMSPCPPLVPRPAMFPWPQPLPHPHFSLYPNPYAIPGQLGPFRHPSPHPPPVMTPSFMSNESPLHASAQEKTFSPPESEFSAETSEEGPVTCARILPYHMYVQHKHIIGKDTPVSEDQQSSSDEEESCSDDDHRSEMTDHGMPPLMASSRLAASPGLQSTTSSIHSRSAMSTHSVASSASCNSVVGSEHEATRGDVPASPARQAGNLSVPKSAVITGVKAKKVSVLLQKKKRKVAEVDEPQEKKSKGGSEAVKGGKTAAASSSNVKHHKVLARVRKHKLRAKKAKEALVVSGKRKRYPTEKKEAADTAKMIREAIRSGDVKQMKKVTAVSSSGKKSTSPSSAGSLTAAAKTSKPSVPVARKGHTGTLNTKPSKETKTVASHSREEELVGGDCPVIGCNGLGHARAGFATHRSMSGCPLAKAWSTIHESEIDQTLRHMHKVQKLREKIAEEDRLLTVLSPFKHSLEALLANLETKRQQAEDAARENNVASAAIPANCHAPAEAGDAGPAATVLPGLA